MNFIPMKNNIVCRACNTISHIAKFYRRKISALVDKNKLDEKGKMRFDEIRDQHKKMWVKKEDSNVQNDSTPDSGVGTSFGN